MSTQSSPQSACAAHIHAVEKKERNGKWKVRSVEAFSDLHPESTDAGFLRYRHLLSAQGESFEDACDRAWAKFKTDPAMRPYMVQIIRAL